MAAPQIARSGALPEGPRAYLVALETLTRRIEGVWRAHPCAVIWSCIRAALPLRRLAVKRVVAQRAAAGLVASGCPLLGW